MENKTLFSEILERQSDLLERIRHAAHEAHAAVNQFYGVDLPYSYHLDGVAELVARYGGCLLYTSCSSSASWNAPFLNTPMCPVNERAPSGNTTNEVPSFRISRALA